MRRGEESSRRGLNPAKDATTRGSVVAERFKRASFFALGDRRDPESPARSACEPLIARASILPVPTLNDRSRRPEPGTESQRPTARAARGYPRRNHHCCVNGSSTTPLFRAELIRLERGGHGRRGML